MIYGILIIFFFYCFGFLATYKSKRKKNAIVHSDLNYSCIWFIHIKRFDICYVYTFPSLTSAHLFVSPPPPTTPTLPTPTHPTPTLPTPTLPTPTLPTPTLPTLPTPSRIPNQYFRGWVDGWVDGWVCAGRCT